VVTKTSPLAALATAAMLAVSFGALPGTAGGLRRVAESSGAAEQIERIRQAADKNDAEAQYELGLAYAAGEGVQQDLTQAISWLRKAADRGHADAQNELGVMYDNGTGVTQDPGQAFEWFRKAAEQGHLPAQNNVGLMYEIGRGVSLDYGEAVKWYRKSAEQGWPAAQASLGLMYVGGVGVARDLVEADVWFQLAALRTSGEEHTRYDGLRETLEAKMTVGDIIEARQRAREWIRRFERR
jgi:tetratricopeptide (TPR) repeat protein